MRPPAYSSPDARALPRFLVLQASSRAPSCRYSSFLRVHEPSGPLVNPRRREKAVRPDTESSSTALQSTMTPPVRLATGAQACGVPSSSPGRRVFQLAVHGSGCPHPVPDHTACDSLRLCYWPTGRWSLRTPFRCTYASPWRTTRFPARSSILDAPPRSSTGKISRIKLFANVDDTRQRRTLQLPQGARMDRIQTRGRPITEEQCEPFCIREGLPRFAFLLPVTGREVNGDLELATRLVAHVGNRHPGMQFDEREAVFRLDVENAQVGDDHVHHALAGDR